MVQQFQKIKSINGTLYLSGDKSISHRALLISSLAKGKSAIKNLSNSDDVKSTMRCLASLGINFEHSDEKIIVIWEWIQRVSAFNQSYQCRKFGNNRTIINWNTCCTKF